MLSIYLDSVVQVIKVVKYDNNRVPLTDIFNGKKQSDLIYGNEKLL